MIRTAPPVRRPWTTIVVAAAMLATAVPATSRLDARMPASSSESLPINSELRLWVVGGRELELEIPVETGDRYEDLALRYAGSAMQADAVTAWNDHRRLENVTHVRIPLALLKPDYRAMVLLNLFPDDRMDGGDWIHVAQAGRLPTYGEGMWEVAEWFTGRGDNFLKLLEVNSASSPDLEDGQIIRIPSGMLHDALQLGERSDDGSLVYDKDESGPYAGYRLKPGEALYSAVVVRYTGRTDSDDVVEIAGMLANRSGIEDLRDIPVGYLVKIPLDYLEPEFLPRGHPRRREAEAARAEVAESLAQRPVPGATGLSGVVLILDPGHGGRDLGTMNHDVWEHDYVYDVTCRLVALLKRHSAARIVMTLRDENNACVPSVGDHLEKNFQGTIQTHPPFLAKEKGEARIGVNLRWYLANSIYRKENSAGTDPDRIVFVSLHADARHRALRGAMVYVPGARYRAKTYGHTGAPYDRYQEVREKPTVRFSYKNRIRSEAVSRKLADSILKGFRQEGLTVPRKTNPVRDRVIRGRRQYVPAVIRNNEIPAKVLVEMVNLNNPKDAALLGRARDREKLATALARGLFDYFGEQTPEALLVP